MCFSRHVAKFLFMYLKIGLRSNQNHEIPQHYMRVSKDIMTLNIYVDIITMKITNGNLKSRVIEM